MARRLLPLLCAAAALLAAGCGDDPSKRVDKAELRGIVQRFAQAHDASACGLLSDQALINVYGGFDKTAAQSRAVCVKRSSGFKGQPVRVTSMQVLDDQTVRVGALSQKGDVQYTVNMRRFGNAWKIDRINQSKPG